eukprot:36763-Eustigmatos_ZCMA.PRE.1
MENRGRILHCNSKAKLLVLCVARTTSCVVRVYEAPINGGYGLYGYRQMGGARHSDRNRCDM